MSIVYDPNQDRLIIDHGKPVKARGHVLYAALLDAGLNPCDIGPVSIPGHVDVIPGDGAAALDERSAHHRDRSDRLSAKADEAADRSRAVVAGIECGQPVTSAGVGRRLRRARDASANHGAKSVQLDQAADLAAFRARQATARAAHRRSPEYAASRLRRAETALRRLERRSGQLDGTHAALGEHECATWLLRQQIDYWGRRRGPDPVAIDAWT